MQELKNWSMLIIMLISLPVLIACGKDDDSQNDGTAANYTIDEIKEMLYGEWDVYGDLNITFSEASKNNFNDSFGGVMEFSDGGTDYVYLSLKITKGKAYSKQSNGKPFYAENTFISERKMKCQIKRKNANYFIETQGGYRFEIISLQKTSIKLILEQDIITESKVEGNIHMTVNTTTNPVIPEPDIPDVSDNPNDTIILSLEGTWSGIMYVHTSYNGRNYYATSTDMEFIGDPLRRTMGTGYWVDHYSGAPWDYVANHIEWKVNNRNIDIYFIEEDTRMTISDYRLSDNYFTGYIYDGSNDVEFRLRHIDSPNWGSYRYGFDYYW